MRNFILISLILTFSSCIVLPPVTWENTNANLIHKSIQNLNTVGKLKKHLNKSDKIVVLGVEDARVYDYSLLATLEDEIIKQFVEKGYRMLERDHDMIYNLFSESNDTYKYVNRVKQAEASKSVAGGGSNFGSADLYFRGSSHAYAFENSSAVKNYNQEYKSNLSTADKIISYRVIESGVTYNDEDKEIKVGEIKREARTILEIRLTNAKTSEIIAAMTLDGQASDFVDQDDIPSLEKFHYKYYSRTLPKKYGNPKEVTVTKKKTFIWPITAGIVSFLWIISLISNN